MYAGLPYNLVVYEGYIPSDPGALTSLPTSNVIDNLDESSGRLGCGTYNVFVTQRCTSGLSCVLEDITNLHYERRLDAISEAKVEINLGGETSYTCCQCLADVEPWCHELHIWRDGDEVWVGPITKIAYSYSKVIIDAKDSLGWLEVRVPPIDIDFSAVATDPVDIGEFIVQTAFAEDIVTCEVDNLYTQPSGLTTLFFAEAFSGYAIEILQNVAEIGLDYTVLGRTIVLVGDSAPFTPLVLLNDEHIKGEIEITKNGLLQENRAYVHFDGDLGTPASGEAASFFCYGPIERLHDGAGLIDGTSAGQAADIYVASAAIAPRVMEIPPGSKLIPDTPWTFDKMVPGCRVDVAIVKTCFQLTQSFRLTEVQIDVTPQRGEEVGITLSPIDSPA